MTRDKRACACGERATYPHRRPFLLTADGVFKNDQKMNTGLSESVLKVIFPGPQF
jgi:hypothetical protein